MMNVNRSFRMVEYYGLGETENYPDIKEHARLGIYRVPVDDFRMRTIRPQEGGNRCSCRWARLMSEKTALHIQGAPFHFNAGCFDMDQLIRTSHDHELVHAPYHQIHIDGFVSGIGSHSCGYPPDDIYKVLPGKMEYSFTLSFEEREEIEQ
jgi:hypothetical protein